MRGDQVLLLIFNSYPVILLTNDNVSYYTARATLVHSCPDDISCCNDFTQFGISGLLSCVTKEEFVDFTIQIIENSMGEENYLGSIESLFVIILSNISAYMRQKTKELNNPV